MDTRAGTVLVCIVLSWGLAYVPSTQCYSTDRGGSSTCWLESSLETEMKPWDIEIELVNWDKLKLNMLKTLMLYRKLDYSYLDKNIIVDKNSEQSCKPKMLKKL